MELSSYYQRASLRAALSESDPFAQLRRWNNGSLQRMAQHLAEGHPKDFELAQQDALDCIELGLASAEEAEAIRLQIIYYRYQYCGIFEPPGAHRAAWRRAQRALVEPALQPLAERLRLRLYAQLMCKGDVLGYCELSPEKLAELVDAVQESERNPEFWFCVSACSFRYSEPQFVELAYSSLLVQPGGYLATPSWLRVNLMLLMLEGRATELDVLSYVEAIRIPALLDEFHTLFMRQIESSGLMSKSLEAALALCHNRVEHESDVRLYEAPTRRIRSGI